VNHQKDDIFAGLSAEPFDGEMYAASSAELPKLNVSECAVSPPIPKSQSVPEVTPAAKARLGAKVNYYCHHHNRRNYHHYSCKLSDIFAKLLLQGNFVYTVSEKIRHHTHVDNFVKYYLIFKILSAQFLLQNDHYISNHTLKTAVFDSLFRKLIMM